MPERFDDEILELLRGAREVRIETTRGPAAPVHRTVIWVVVDPDGRVLVRSYRGATARWFREAVENPEVAVGVGGESILAVALVATDPARIEAASRGYLQKYATSQGLKSMLADEVLGTTLELVPR